MRARILFISVVILGGAVTFVTHLNAQKTEQLYGTWRLIKYTRTIVATGETQAVFGKMPVGFVNYGRDGRMMAIVVSEKRSAPTDPVHVTDAERAELYKTMFAYAGTFDFDGTTITHHVDVSYNQTWTATDLIRKVKFDAGRLILTTVPAISNIDGQMTFAVLTWERVR